MQQDVVAATIRNEILQKKPLPNSYIMNFMKVFMSKVINLVLHTFLPNLLVIISKLHDF